ncbi:LEAF RUST 10 DISEASE-RESISTANCE LOCUS RECEPTOR-LIKE PROTEIN KINASE-like 2.4 [Humulus lupulus]|uniref:LEAF RUST 10 DISEASE-RESISTANCE LOCUS RECEPTOR-LIKE PROTEIN KINASE-like 2.4 n=1 Tax=Humulus lupulus TaxID=3486 RepID=UPI002B4070BF|nr:LEAF RUST 10 DISEASE-RESISTANCE LOCUS RECEPTOR-LIKE PROTEIN KINASE-like 2.4 [Humulus lupulus]XP_062117480.1 LEAF RUST 10 DISEASE-RESISTANCE LOCUS RECEPTOR-LIKE PROTEIN KINASE-like 2.4 [Humulus lupulus]XP_062117481.1 LEAF RUST 10 DISEASE-RESISTANCE LOCUS RECEPTOR-LIKE PROTEIN KINASE-like 2.4 [Humulus lupulus]
MVRVLLRDTYVSITLFHIMEALSLPLFTMMITTIFHETTHGAVNTPCFSSCGNIHNITSPFRLETDPPSCVSTTLYNSNAFVLSCKNNRTILKDDGRGYYHVQAINYNNYTIRLVDSNLHKGNCSSIPTYSSLPSPFELQITFRLGERFWSANFITYQTSERVLFLSCEKKVSNSLYIDTAPCINSSKLSENPKSRFLYAVYASGFKYSDLAESCQIYQTALISSRKNDKKKKMTMSYRDIHDEFTYGFEASWLRVLQKHVKENFCYISERYNKAYCIYSYCRAIRLARNLVCRLWYVFDKRLMLPTAHLSLDFICLRWRNIVEILAPRTIIGLSFVIGLIIYKWKRRHLSIYKDIEEYLQRQNNLMPVRYSYLDIKKMTTCFKHKLGEGGFGSVYKGKLRSGHYVAIKMLSKSKTSGQDFINEVSTIGRIHHANVVRLVGFCVEGSKRALVYEFMPNGSLNNHIFIGGKERNNSLSDEKIFDISLGIARGIEYLHQGCDMQILHFDIKPHNILLDESFIPKVSDFGLARLCPIENNIVPLTTVRGTVGYIAPELFYKNIGGVSHKADVYSFGMLLMEMASRRRNLNPQTVHSSKIYFPLWVYDHIDEVKSIELKDNVNDEQEKKTKKMIMVALWCIQMKPCDRPSISKVIEMLESHIECLEMPPKPYLYPQDSYNNVIYTSGETLNTRCSSSLSYEDY